MGLVLDLGLATKDVPNTEWRVGTEGWQMPEMMDIESEGYDYMVDAFGLGLVVSSAVFGRHIKEDHRFSSHGPAASTSDTDHQFRPFALANDDADGRALWNVAAVCGLWDPKDRPPLEQSAHQLRPDE